MFQSLIDEQLDNFSMFYEVRFSSLLPLNTKSCRLLFTENKGVFFYQRNKSYVIMIFKISGKVKLVY